LISGHDRHSKINGLKQVAIAPGTAAILWRAGTLAVHAPGVLGRGIGAQHLLHLDDVLPIVAEVVDVPEPLDALGHEVSQLGFAGAGQVHFVPRVVTVIHAVDVERPQVRVRPAHRRLDDLVQRRQ
jgi:hypothetical protein